MRKKKEKHRSKVGRGIKITFQFMLLITLLAVLGGILYFYLNYGKTILQMQREANRKVDASTENTFRSSQTSLVYDSKGGLISTLKSDKDVYYIKYEDIPAAAVDAMVVTEDRNFFEHDGVDYWANVRAAMELIKHKGRITQGASTITQQVARNTFLTQEVTYTRKIKEIFTAQELEKKYNKKQIMEFYLNGSYFANGHYGLQAAAQAYFGKGVASLSLSQIAFICSIPNNPNLYNPLNHMDNTLKRRDRILKQLYDNGKIDNAEYKTALDETITLNKDKTERKNYVETYAYHCAIRALMKKEGFKFQYQFDSDEDRKAYDKSYNKLYNGIQKQLYTNGYRIYTSIDLDKQKILQKSVDNVLAGFKEKSKDGIYKMQGAAVSIDNDTGRVVAIVGGRKQKQEGYTLNRAYQSFRQPGSSIKPLIVYTPAFEREYTPNTIVNDKPIKDGPKNSNGRYLGKIKLLKAVENSINTIAWQLFEEITPQNALSYLLNMNYSKIVRSDYTQATALGGLTYGVSPVEMASAYATLENDGYYREPTCIVKIMDSQGNVIVDDKAPSSEVYDTNAARTMTECLTGVIKYGTARGLGLSYTVSAGKTGTTNDKKDGWFVGYTPYYTTSVWVGCDIPVAVYNLQGASYPGSIWHDYMQQIHTPSMTRKFKTYNWKAKEEKAKQEEDKNKISVTPTITPDQTEFNDNTGDATDTGEDQDTTDNTDTGAGQTGDNSSDTDTTGNDATNTPPGTKDNATDHGNGGINSDGSNTNNTNPGNNAQ